MLSQELTWIGRAFLILHSLLCLLPSDFLSPFPYATQSNSTQPNRHTHGEPLNGPIRRRMSCREWICFCLAGFLFVTAAVALESNLVANRIIERRLLSQDEINSDCYKICFTTVLGLQTRLNSFGPRRSVLVVVAVVGEIWRIGIS